VVIQHVAHEPPGLLSELAAGRGIELEVRRMDLDDPLPGVEELGGLIVLGGPMGVHDADEHSWLAPERELLAAALERGLPVVGVCLGSQQLAAALGAEVRQGPELEIGIGEVELTEVGRQDPVLGPLGPRPPVMHWHQDTFDVPPGAVRLAGNDRYANQAFRVGELAYGLQFHLELDRSLADSLRPHLPADVELAAPGCARVEAAGRSALGRFFDLALRR
jgi:GMP synthase-like glutamine amidotransferase